MARRVWTEKKIAKMLVEGYGEGALSDYKPWIQVKDFSSLGRSRRIWSAKTCRTHHLLSDVEYRLFVALEWQRDVIDIREQFPLDRSLTQDVARSLGIVHPYYPGTDVPTVMTVDFMATVKRHGTPLLIAFNAKTSAEAEDERSMLKLEIQREYFAQMDVAHHIIFDCDFPLTNIANISDIREAPMRPDELEPRPGYFSELCERMLSDMPSQRQNMSLATYCIEFDARFGCPPGAGIRIARILMFERRLVPNLGALNLNQEPLSNFVLLTTSCAAHVRGGL